MRRPVYARLDAANLIAQAHERSAVWRQIDELGLDVVQRDLEREIALDWASALVNTGYPDDWT